MKYVIDIDGVICNENVEVKDRQGWPERIKKINILYDHGHEIVYFTARGMNSQHDDQIKSDMKYRKITEKQLSDWGCKYHALFFGKPNCDFYIDNKNMTIEEFFYD